MLIGITAILTNGRGITGIFSNDPSLIEISTVYLMIATAGYAMMPFVIVFGQAISGAGDTLPPMFISIFMVWAIQIPLAFILPDINDLGAIGLRWAIVSGNFVGALAYTTYFISGRWKRKLI